MAFTTSEELFELMVMFLGLTNLLAIFQAIMNELIRNLINIGKVESFINNVIVETESEEEHNELVEKVLRRMEENNLYVKLEKCKWKVDFLKVVIRPEEIKIEEEKVKAVLNWPIPKSVKNIQNFLRLANYY